MVSRNAAHTYARIGLETGVVAASPHSLVLMLFDGALGAVTGASAHLAAGRIADKGQQISRAISIINEGLQASLDLARGGRIAHGLLQLYDYMSRRLFWANVNNDRAALLEVAQLLGDLRTTWAAIGQAGAASMPPAAAARQAAA